MGLIKMKFTNELNEFAINIINTVREPLLVLDKDLRVIKASRSFYNIFKVTSDETIGKLIYDLGNRQWDIPKLRELLETILPEKTTFDDYEVEHDFSTIGKRVMLLNARQIKRAFGKEKIILLAMEDITTRKHEEGKKSEETLRKSEEKHRVLIEQMYEGLFEVNNDDVIQFVNPMFCKMLGYEENELIGKVAYKILQDENEGRKIIEKNLNRLEGQSEQYEWRMIKKSGEQITLIMNAAPVRDKSGKVVGSLSTCIDITERKRTLEKLQESEKLFRLTAENLTDVIYEWDLKQKLDWYGDIDGITGYPPGGFPRTIEGWSAAVHPEDKDRVTAALEDHLKGVAAYAIEYRVRRKDGEWQWWSARGTALRNDRGEPYKMMGSITDISERKLSADALRASEAKFRSYVNDSPQGIFVVNAKGQYIDANNAALNQLGCSKEYLLQKTIADILPKEELEKGLNHFNKLVKEGKSTTEIGLLKTNGEIIYVILDTVKISDDQFLGFSTDITKRKQAAEALSNERSLLRTIIDLIPDAIYAVDIEGRKILANAKEIELSGKSSEDEIIGKTDFDLYPESEAQRYYEDDQIIIKSGKPILDVEDTLISKDGEILWLLGSKVPLRDAHGQITGIVGVNHDITDRKRAEEVLRQERDFSRTIVQTSPTFFVAIGSDGKTIMMNDSMLKALGYTLSEVVGTDYLTNFIPREDREKISKIFEALAITNKTTVNENPILTKDGGKIIVEWYGKNILKPNGELNYFFGIGIDITERKRSEEVLRESEEKYRSFFENSLDSILLTSPDGRIFSANPAACKMFGYSQKELIRLGKSAIVDMTDPQLPILLAKRALNRKARGEIKLIRKDGTQFLAEVSSAIFKDQEGHDRTSMIISDITERKRAEEEITMLAHSLRSISECVSITDLEDKILFVNESFLKTYGYAENELIGKQISIVRSMNNPPEFVKEILPATIHGEWQGELLNKRKDGSEFPVYLSTTIIKDKESKPLGLIGVAKDITEPKRAEKELIEAKEKAEQSDKLKSEFLAQMSHEIRTPLSTIVGNVDLLSDSFRKEIFPEAIDFFDNIDVASKRIIRTIDLVLNSAQLQTSGYKPRFIKVDFNSLILNKLFQEYQLSAKQKGLEMIYKCELKETIILADEYSVTQIFANLIDNAIKYTKKGKVEILIEKNKTGKIIVEVKDTGIGISKEFLPRLFGSFTQEEHGNTRKFDGNGLGLSLVKSYCELNNAVIEVESEKNVGSTFRVIFN